MPPISVSGMGELILSDPFIQAVATRGRWTRAARPLPVVSFVNRPHLFSLDSYEDGHKDEEVSSSWA